MTKTEKQLVTIYTVGGLGATTIQGTLISTEDRENYDRLPVKVVKYTAKGKRKPSQISSFVKKDDACLIVLAGHNHPIAPGGLDKTATGAMSRYGSFDPRYLSDFLEWVAPVLAATKPEDIILDIRPPA